MQCPIHKNNLVRLKKGISLVCPRCGYKTIIPSKFSLPEMRHTITIPNAFAWATWTLTNLTTNESGYLVLSSGAIEGTAISPQMINLTRKSTRYWDCTKVALDWTQTLNDGKVVYFASNDAVGYRHIRSENSNYELNKGNEVPQYRQSKYNDLRIKVVITRTTSSDTSPTVSLIVVTHNKVQL